MDNLYEWQFLLNRAELTLLEAHDKGKLLNGLIDAERAVELSFHGYPFPLVRLASYHAKLGEYTKAVSYQRGSFTSVEVFCFKR